MKTRMGGMATVRYGADVNTTLAYFGPKRGSAQVIFDAQPWFLLSQITAIGANLRILWTNT